MLLVAVLAEAFSLAHLYDSAAHANGQVCAICVGAASFGAAAVGSPLHFDAVVAPPAPAIVALVVLFSAVPTRRYVIAAGAPLRGAAGNC
jgi:hypothetical protein